MKLILLAAIILLTVSCTGRDDIKKADLQTLRLYTNAGELYSGGQFLEAAALLDGIKDFSPALTLRAKALYFSGDLSNAEKSCRQAIKLRPGNFEAKLYLARTFRDRGETEKARLLTENLLADNPGDVRLLRLAAAIAAEQGEAARASALLDRAAEMTADGAMALLDRARLRWVAGRSSEALEDLARARAMLPWETPVARSINQLESRITEAMQ
jgi:tetratricopeptide (TPR) repeat protein